MKINVWCPYIGVMGKISKNIVIINIEITSNRMLCLLVIQN